MNKDEYIRQAQESANYFISKGVDDKGRRIKDPSAYMRAAIERAEYDWNNYTKDTLPTYR